MKKHIFGTILFLLGMFLFTPGALAEEMKVSVTATPTELSDTGTVAFSFVVSNYSDYELGDIKINYLGTEYEILKDQTIPPNGEARDIVLDLTVSESQLGTPINFIVSGVRSGEPISQQVQITIARVNEPVITVQRSASTTMVRQGENVTMTYTLKNETKFDMTGITLIDENISDNPILKQDTLRAGDTFSLDRTYTMGTESVTSTPFVTYTVNGKTKTFSAIEPLTLNMLLVKLDMKVDAGMPTASGVNFTLSIKNTGNQAIENIMVTDERLNAVNDSPFSLKEGQDMTLSFQVVPVMTEAVRQVKFLLNGKDALGQDYKLESTGTFEVYPFVDDSQISVVVQAETVTPWTGGTGKLTTRIIVTNHSAVALTNVTISEVTLGVLKSYDSLPAGMTSFDQEVLLGSPRNLQFSVKGNDPTGTLRELGGCTLPVAYGTEETPSPDATPTPAGGDNMGMFNFLSSTISKILVGLGVLMVLSFIVLITLSIMERSRSALYRYDDEEDDEYEDDMDDLFDSPPVRQPTEQELEREERDYTNRMQTSMRRQQTIREPIPLPPAAETTRPQNVRIEYEDSYEGQRAYSPGAHGQERSGIQPPAYDAGMRSQGLQDATMRVQQRGGTVQQPPVRTQNDPYESQTTQNAATYRTSQWQTSAERDMNAEMERAASELAGQAARPPRTVTARRSRETEFLYDDGEEYVVAPETLHTPKVYETKVQPTVQPQMRNQIRHVRASQNKDKDSRKDT